MKIETLKSRKRKYFLYALIMGVVLLLPLVLSITFGKYQTRESIKLVEGSITYKPYELNVVAVNIENDNGEYVYSEDIPTSGYYLDDSKSYCEVKNVKDNSIKLEYTGSKLEVTNISKKGTRCYAYFNKTKSKVCPSGASACETIMNNIKTIGERNNITGPLSATTTKIIYQAEDNDGTSYYYAGNPTDNWVKFAGFYWRIIRINGDGTIRMIYSGDETSGPTTTGLETQVDKSTYSFAYNDNAYMGYMSGTPGSSTYEETHTNINDSKLKTVVDNWYAENLLNYNSYIDENAGFCNDRTTDENGWNGYGNLGYGINPTAYSPLGRLSYKYWKEVQTPTLKCFQDNDLFTTTSSIKGNKKLIYPVGLITSDELVYAGGFGAKENLNFYLYTGQGYWTISPNVLHSYGNYVYIFALNSNGSVEGYHSYGSIGVRPVINLKANTQFSSGTGTASNPYVVE